MSLLLLKCIFLVGVVLVAYVLCFVDATAPRIAAGALVLIGGPTALWKAIDAAIKRTARAIVDEAEYYED
jgi:hypothetical protein